MSNNTKPILSIITINRNNADGLRKTMQSVLTQASAKDGEIEYIIIDGESTDNSVGVIKEFLENPEYAKTITYWVSEKDTGIYNAMNKGLKKANGTLTALMNSGDYYLPNALDGIIEMHKVNPESVLYGALKAMKGDKFESIWGNNANILVRQMIPHLSTFVPKCLYEKYGLFDESYKIAGDYDLFLRFYTSKVDFLWIDKIICCFNLEGISQNNENVKTETENVKKKYGFYIPPTPKQRIKKIIKTIFPFL